MRVPSEDGHLGRTHDDASFSGDVPLGQARGGTPLHVLFAAHPCYLDDSNGASVASRGLMQALARRGLAVEVLTGAALDMATDVDVDDWLAGRGHQTRDRDEPGSHVGGISAARVIVRGVPITVHRGPSTLAGEPEEAGRREFLCLLDEAFDRLRPDVLVGYGGDRLASEIFARARSRGVATAFTLHNFGYLHSGPFANADAVLVPSRFSAEYHATALGLDCTVQPYLIDIERVRARRHEPRYATFVNPSSEKGAYAFARIAEELGRIRPDIPLLVVEGRGAAATLARCGFDLGARGNVHLMGHTTDPRAFWEITRVCIMPSLWWESFGLVAAEAMLNGVPVIASDRGALPETLGAAGIVLPLPGRLTATTRIVPEPEEVAPWVEAIIRLWDDDGHYREHRRLAIEESRRWASDKLEPGLVDAFESSRPGRTPPPPPSARLRRVDAAVLVPYGDAIVPECERGLRGLERAGVRVVRQGGCGRPDEARDIMASEALREGIGAVLFVDPDLGFKPRDALRLLARPEPVVAGIYPAAGVAGLNGRFAPGVEEVIFGHALGLYPMDYAAPGFLRIRIDALRRLVEGPDLPECDTDRGRGWWPFFLPLTVPIPAGGHRYLGPDAAFGYRLGRVGIVPLGDTSIRLWRHGRYAYGWEDAAEALPRRHPHVLRVGRP